MRPLTLKFKLTIAYDGTHYEGWQFQKTGTGVQEKVETALAKLFPSHPRLHSSSRTDTGVHALGMVAHFEVSSRECTMPPAKPHAVFVRDYFAASVPTIPRLLQTESIATGDLQAVTSMPGSLWSFLSGEFQESSLCLADIAQCESAGFDEVSHDGPASAPEHAEQFVHQPALRGFAGNRRFENERSSNLLYTTNGFLDFQPVNHRLHGCEREPFSRRKRFVNLPDRTRPPAPEGFHDLKFRLG